MEKIAKSENLILNHLQPAGWTWREKSLAQGLRKHDVENPLSEDSMSSFTKRTLSRQWFCVKTQPANELSISAANKSNKMRQRRTHCTCMCQQWGTPSVCLCVSVCVFWILVDRCAFVGLCVCWRAETGRASLDLTVETYFVFVCVCLCEWLMKLTRDDLCVQQWEDGERLCASVHFGVCVCVCATVCATKL